MSPLAGKNWHWNLFDLFLVLNAAVEIMVPVSLVQREGT